MISNEQQFEIARWCEIHTARFRAGVPPTDDDAKWFDRNRRSRDGWPRIYRVRNSIAMDHWAFALGYADAKGFLTIVRRDEWWRAVIATDESTFGPVVDSDSYARLRLHHVRGIPWKNDAGWK